MNPPYVALGRLRGEPLARALQVRFADGTNVPLKVNYWCVFLLRGIECLRAGGALVAVLPAAWDFARYASRVRESVTQAFREVSVIRCARPLFPNVKEGSVVIVARGRGEPNGSVRRIEVPDLDSATRALREIATRRLPKGAVVVRSVAVTSEAHVRLDEVVQIRIGAVTGDAKYFLLTETERLALGLPRTAVRPVLSRRKHLTAALLGEKDWARLRDNGARIWLFRPTAMAARHPAVVAYLKKGRLGACNISGLKISSRDPWHRTPVPRRVDGFLSGMSKCLPFLVLRGMKQLSATNTLYVVSFKKAPRMLDRAALGMVLLTSSVRRELARHARVYAGGLLKFEPTELGSIRVPVVRSRRDAMAVFKKATTLLLSGREADAEALADAWVDSCRRASIELPNVRRTLVAVGA